MNVLVHNNLRAMWHSAFSQDMADTFVARHLRNATEFWTSFPLPSIAADDPKYKPGIPRNSWAGPAEGLTYQRAVRALENYGYHSEITVLGGKLLDAINASKPDRASDPIGARFPQQWNPQAYVDDAVCFVYTCRRLIDLSLVAGTMERRQLRPGRVTATARRCCRCSSTRRMRMG